MAYCATVIHDLSTDVCARFYLKSLNISVFVMSVYENDGTTVKYVK